VDEWSAARFFLTLFLVFGALGDGVPRKYTSTYHHSDETTTNRLLFIELPNNA